MMCKWGTYKKVKGLDEPVSQSMAKIIGQRRGNKMKRICAWCKRSMGEKEPLDNPKETHGIWRVG